MQPRHRLAVEHQRAADQQQAEAARARGRAAAGNSRAPSCRRCRANSRARPAAPTAAKPQNITPDQKSFGARIRIPTLTSRCRQRDQIGCGLLRQCRRDDVRYCCSESRGASPGNAADSHRTTPRRQAVASASRHCGACSKHIALPPAVWIGLTRSSRFRATSIAQQVVMTSGFIEQHGLWSDDQRRHAEELKYRIEKDDIQLIRVAWADPHGAVARQDRDGAGVRRRARRPATTSTSRPRTLDSANARTFASFTRGGGMGLDEMTGSPNLTIVPDPATFRLLPWAPKVGWVLCDEYFNSGVPFHFSPRQVLRRQLKRLAERGMGCVRRARDRVVPGSHRRPASGRRAHRLSGRARPADRRPSRPSRASPITPKPTWT